jgi:predicted metal-binding membrane protein
MASLTQSLQLSRRTLDGAAVGAGLLGLTSAAWWYIAVEAPRSMGMTMGSMHRGMDAMAAQPPVWTASTFAIGVLMWAAMMTAMMVPTATPMTFIYGAVARKARAQGAPVAATYVFVSGYVAVWALFGVGAAAAQYGLSHWKVLSSGMAFDNRVLAGIVLVGVVLYQFSPVKRACLANCRAPAHFISRHWRAGATGAVRMGFRHGLYCLGCCWALMLLLFVGGVMNLVWVAAITGYVLVEKTQLFGARLGRFVGSAAMTVGVLVLARTALFG